MRPWGAEARRRPHVPAASIGRGGRARASDAADAEDGDDCGASATREADRTAAAKPQVRSADAAAAAGGASGMEAPGRTRPSAERRRRPGGARRGRSWAPIGSRGQGGGAGRAPAAGRESSRRARGGRRPGRMQESLIPYWRENPNPRIGWGCVLIIMSWAWPITEGQESKCTHTLI
jgi:hypothetical protein